MPDGQALKNLLKRGSRAGARIFGPLLLQRPAATRILTYHSIGYRRYEMNVTPEAFAEQIGWLSARFPVISLARAAAGEPGVALTFDDGYRDNLTHAIPVLERFQCPATIFMVTGFAANTLPFDREPETGHLLSESELRELAARGFEIGGHTRTHPRLAGLTAEAQNTEIAGCRSDLERILGRPVTAFAYPFGSALDYDETSIEGVRKAGFTIACSNRYGPVRPGDAPHQFRRIWIDQTDTLDSFQDKVSGRLDLLGVQDSPLGIRARRWLNRRLLPR